jgi:signal transduction histidine kinase/ActR/RegA family two-component response regulator
MRPTAATVQATAVFLAVVAVGGAALVELDADARAERLRDARDDAVGTARAVEDQLGRSLAAAHALAGIVRQSGRIDDFPSVARGMLSVYPGVSALQLAPGGVIREVEPLAGNEAAVGIDLFEVRPLWAERARDTRQLTLDGPFALRQGGLGLVGRLAVFRREDNREVFWGLVAVVVRLESFLAEAHLADLTARGYAWELSRVEPAAAEPLFARAGGPLRRETVALDLAVPNGTWRLAVSARPRPASSTLLLGAMLVLAVAVAISLLARRVLRQPEELRRRVTERTAELEHARRQLEAELVARQEAQAARETAEEQARQAQRLEALGQLAGGVAHDFNNLLTGILGYAELIDSPDPLVQEAARGIRTAANRAASLTRQLLGFARRGKHLSTTVDLHALVREVAALLERTLTRDIALSTRLLAPRATVRGDPSQLQQIVLNLAVNARDAMPEGGSLTFETRALRLDEAAGRALSGLPPGDYVQLTVADSGVGIPVAIHGRVFEPFFTTKPPGQGSGMGLAMVYGIVRNHAGAVDFTSEEGRGTRFTVTLPLTTAVQQAEGEVPRPWPRRGLRVLLVDDEAVVRDATSRLLRSVGCEVVAAASAEEALERLQQGVDPELILVDLTMPGLDGVACLEAVRKLKPRLPALLTSGYGQDGRVQTALESGFQGFLQKPFDRGELTVAIERALRPADPPPVSPCLQPGHPAAGPVPKG